MNWLTWRRLALPLALFLSFVCPASAGAASNVVIRQVYGGGGNAGAPYANDFVELFNRSPSAVNLAGASLQYAPSGQLFTQSVALSGVIPAGGYYLIKLGGGATGAAYLPVADAVGSINLNAAAGTVALVSGTALVSSCGASTLVDIVSYGPGSLCSEGPAAAVTSDTTSVTRLSFGCQDTDNNQNDFQVTPPRPLNSLSSQHPCTSTDCATQFEAIVAQVPAGSGQGFVNVQTAEECTWTAVSHAPFITIVSNAAGKGAAPVVFGIEANPGSSPRTGTLTIAGGTVTVTQAAGSGGVPGGGTPPAGPELAIDSPTPSAVLTSAFEVVGWALDPTVSSGTGVDAVQFYILPNDGGSPVFLGAGSYGLPRPDVGAMFGHRFDNSGYHFTVTGMRPGDYRLGVYARSVATGSFSIVRIIPITVQGIALMSIDAPAPESTITAASFGVAGWAIERSEAPGTGTGVDALHIYAYPNPGSGEPAIFLGVATMGFERPDVAGFYGEKYLRSGYLLHVDRASVGLTPGVYNIAVVAHSTASNEFNNLAVVRVVIPQ